MRAHSILFTILAGLALALCCIMFWVSMGQEVPVENTEIPHVHPVDDLTTHSSTYTSVGNSDISANTGVNKIKTGHTRRMPFVIPVVVNIIHSPDQNGQLYPFPNDASVVAGVDWINNLLAGGPACTEDPLSSEIGIQLCLASRDIHGGESTGIRRFASELSKMDLCKDDASLKAIPKQQGDLFPDTSYLNIYIVEEICASCKPGDCLAGGYAAYPSAHGTIYDGIVVEAITWMNQECDVRKVILHELGHYFNLKHTWEGNSCKNDNCMVDGDGICDTPPDFDINIYASNPCLQGIPISTCVSDVNPLDSNNPFLTDEPDMTSNLMDYAPPRCIAVFTEGQAERMRNSLSGPRNSLVRSNGCNLPCSDPIIFNIQWPSSPYLFGESIEIINQPQAGVTYSWKWYGGISASQNFNLIADSIGTFVVCVEATGLSTACYAKECDTVVVTCSSAIPEISLSDYHIEPGEEVILRQISSPSPGYTYTWFVDGVPSGSGSSINITPTLSGSMAIWLEECRAGCCSESQHAYLSVGSCPSGKEANHWLFGRDRIHLDWNSGVPVELPPSSARSPESMAIAIDPSGNLLFYSNNEFVYNRDGVQMPNGQLINPGGSSATQFMTLPKPGNDSLWYLFYPDIFASSNPARDTITTLYYAIIDMSLGGGLGEVTLKDQPILRPTTEKVAAVRHCNGIDWWIVGHEANATSGSNRFFSWLLSSSGLSVPVISAVGIPRARTSSTKGGEMNISSDGLHIAMSTGPDFEKDLPPFYTVELFDFDPATGIVSSPLLIGDFIFQPLGLGLHDTYGLEFSPSGDFLYVARAAYSKDSILQYDLRNESPQLIQESGINIYESNSPNQDNFGAMLTGPDQKIYIAGFQNSYLMSINNPNKRGLESNFENHGIDLERGECFLGLPTFPAGINTPGKPFLYGPDIVCDTTSAAKFFLKANCRYQDYIWKTSGFSEITQSIGDTVWVKPHTAGLENLIVEKITACGIKTDTFVFEIKSCRTETVSCNVVFDWNEADTIVCRGEDAWLHFSTQANYVSYTLASDGIEHQLASPVIYLTKPQLDDRVTIYLQMVDGCDTTFQVGIHVNPALDFQINLLDTLVCKGDNATISIDHSPNYLVELFSSDNRWVITNPAWPVELGPINSDSTIYVRVRDFQLSCDSIFEWKIRVEDVQPIGMDTILFCQNDSINYHGNWYYNDTIITTEFARIGCDSLHRTFIIERESLTASLAFQNPCSDGTGVIQVEIQSGIPPYTFSINGSALQSNPIFTGLDEGSYLIEVIDKNGCRFDTTILLKTGLSIGGVQIEATNPTCDIDNGIIHLHSLTSGMQHAINSGSYLPDTLYTGLSDGYYQIISLYPDGCLDTIETELFQLGKPRFESIRIDSSHCGHSDGSINIVSIDGGLSPYYLQIENSDFDTTRQFLDLPGGSYLINISDANNCQNDTLISLPTIPGPSIINVSVTPAVCGLPLGSITVDAISGNMLNYQLGNQPPASSPYFTDLLPGAYTIIITDQYECNQYTDVIVPDSITIQNLNFIVSPELCAKQNGSIDFTLPGPSYNISVAEIPGEIFTQNVTNLKSGAYHLTIQDEFFCMLDTIVEVGLICEIYVPNVFTPNGDGINDYFGPIIPDNLLSIGSFEVFDRWGNLIFRCNHLDSCSWDGMSNGKVNQSGVYAWRMVNSDSEGENQIQTGNVTLIR